MATSTLEDQGGGQDLFKRQRCDNGVPISTRYEVTTITTYSVSYSTPSNPPRTTEPPPETSRPVRITSIRIPTIRTPPPETSTPPRTTTFLVPTFRSPRPQISIVTRTSTTPTRIIPKVADVPTGNDVRPKARAEDDTPIPVTIERTIVTSVPVETIYSCPPRTSSRETTSIVSSPPPTSWIDPTSRDPPITSRSSSWSSWRTSTPSTRPPPSTTSPPPPSTRPSSTIPPPTSTSNSTVTWPPSTTSTTTTTTTTTSPPSSGCVYTDYDGTVPYSYTAPCVSSTSSQPMCTFTHRGGEWDVFPCSSTYTNTSTTTSTLTNTTTSTETITWPCSSFARSQGTWMGVPCTSSINVTSSTWPCSSYATSLERWVSAPCTSTMPNSTTSSIQPCSTFLGSGIGWVPAPCTSTPNITSTPPVTTPPTTTPPITIPPITDNMTCSTYVEGWSTWISVSCNTTTSTTRTTPTVTITPTITFTRNITVTPTITITEPPGITITDTETPTPSHSQRCSTYIPELELWVTIPCNTASPTPSLCLDENQDMWVPCTWVRTSDTDIWSWTSTDTVTSDTIPIVVTATVTPSTRTSPTRLAQTLFPTTIESDSPTLTDTPTRTLETDTHTPTRTQATLRPSAASIGVSSAPEETVHTSRANPGTSPAARTSSTRRGDPPTTQRTEPPNTRPTQPSASTPLTQSSSPSRMLTSNFIIPTASSAGVLVPTPSSTITTVPDGLRGGTIAGIVVGSIIGVVGLLGLGAFLMKALGGHSGRDMYASRGAYQAANGGGSAGGRDEGRGGGGGGGGGGGSGGMSEVRNENPRRSALRNRNIVGGGSGGWSDASWNQTYAYTGVAAAAAVAATSANNQRARDSGSSEQRYSDGGIRDEDTPDAIPQRYGDGGLAGPDSNYDTGISNHPYGNPELHYVVSGSEVQFDPYRDLAARQDSLPTGGNIPRQSGMTSPEVSLSPPGSTPAYNSMQGANLASSHLGSTLQPPQADTALLMSTAGGLSTTSFTPSSIDHSLQPQAVANTYQSSPPYAGNSSLGVPMYQSPEPGGSTDIQRPPYWEGSVPATSVDSLPQNGNIPRYSAFTDVASPPGIGVSLGSGSAPGMGGAGPSTPGIGGTVGVGGAPQGSGVTSPIWNPAGVTEFGQNIIGSSSAPADAETCISGAAAPDPPKGLHQGLTRLSTELASAEARDIDTASPRSASQASVRPLRVGGPRARPQRVPSSRPTEPRPGSTRSLPPAYEEQPSSP